MSLHPYPHSLLPSNHAIGITWSPTPLLVLYIHCHN